ncbi:MAG: hypothetical protein KAT15_17695, partial [Bacteroidales bacterium]|nr:hypothetical protein [Bacteroidales bacterium]
MKYIAFLVALILCIAFTSEPRSDVKTGFPLIYEQDFEDLSSIDGFVFSDPEPWFLTGGKDGGRALEFAGKGNYQTKVRSPFIIGLVSDHIFADFVLEADILQTGREYGHRDICVFFSFQDSSRFYYVHMASKADPNAHNVFIVNDAPRTNIAEETTDGIRWIDEHWHHIRIERFTGDGLVKVYFDDMDTPIMIAHDKTFIEGYLGIGSFDDSGKIDNIRVWSPDARKADAPF